MGNFMSHRAVQPSSRLRTAARYNVTTLCDMMENQAQAPLQNYVDVSNFFLSMQGAPCLDTSYKNVVQSIHQSDRL
jgi:hypothetical protein